MSQIIALLVLIGIFWLFGWLLVSGRKDMLKMEEEKENKVETLARKVLPMAGLRFEETEEPFNKNFPDEKVACYKVWINEDAYRIFCKYNSEAFYAYLLGIQDKIWNDSL